LVVEGRAAEERVATMDPAREMMDRLAREMMDRLARGMMDRLARGMMDHLARGMMDHLARGMMDRLARGMMDRPSNSPEKPSSVARAGGEAAEALLYQPYL
jgi:hypothetical protein